MKIFWALIGILFLAAGVFAWNTVNTPALSIASGSISAKNYQRGFYKIGDYDISLRDTSRAASDSKTSKAGRSITAQLWFPAIEEGFVAPGKHPVYIHIPHYQENAQQFGKTASLLASKGYIVVAIDPAKDSKRLTTWTAIANVQNQIDDIRFLLDTLEAWNHSPDTPFYSRLAFGNVTISGYSSGSISAQLLIFDTELKDDRINAAVFIAPISSMFNEKFFTAQTDMPTLVIATNTDAISNYEGNAVYLASNHQPTWLVNIKEGQHLNFSEPEDFPLSLRRTNDINCEDLRSALALSKTNSPLSELSQARPEIFSSDAQLPACNTQTAAVITAYRQRELSTLAIQAFIESQFADTEIERDVALHFLTETLAIENSDTSVFPPIVNAE